jgi:hypothetical protein
MNNSLNRLIDGMIATLRREIIPATTGAFARGQAYGVVYMLETIKLRTDWSSMFLNEQTLALDNLAASIARLSPPHIPAFPDRSANNYLEVGDAWVCDAYDSWAESPDHPARTFLDAYVHTRLRHEIETSSRPMFAEMSLGEEQTS